MRPTSWSTAILACAITAATADRTGAGEQNIVSFTEFVTGAPGRVFLATALNQSLSWALETGYQVDKVEVWNKEEVIGRWPTNNKTPASKANSGLRKKDSNAPTEVTASGASLIPLNVTGSTLFFNFTTGSQTWEQNFDTKALYAKLSWSGNGEAGFTSSQPFAVASGGPLSVTDALSVVTEATSGTQGAFPAPSTSTTATFLNGNVPAPTGSTSTPSASASIPGGATAPSASSGLEAGVIAGIVIGAVVGLAIVGALVWFFCFRRRKQHSQTREADYGHDAGTHAMMVDKEVPGVSESSPHSAYGDDGGRLHDRSSTAMDSSYAPYSDHASASVAHASPVASHAMTSSQTHLPQHGTGSPTPPATTQYAHLVEEGMTADEIRRLEEEERALDQAIEAAGTHRPAH